MSLSIGKLAVTVIVGGAVISSTILLSQTYSTNKTPLTETKLNEFKQKKGFASCFPFIQKNNKSSLLFICLKKKTSTSDDTYVANYYFYNGKTWEEAISLRNKPNVKNTYLVDTKGGWFGWPAEREIIGIEGESKDLDKVGKNWKCEFKPTEVKDYQRKNRIFSCDLSNTKLRWKLQDFK